MHVPSLRIAFFISTLLLALILAACAPSVKDTAQFSRSSVSTMSDSGMNGLMTDMASIRRDLRGMMNGSTDPERLQDMMWQTGGLMQQMALLISDSDTGADDTMLLRQTGETLSMMQSLLNMMSGYGDMDGLMAQMDTLQQDYDIMSRQNQFDAQSLGDMMGQLGGMMNQMSGLLSNSGMGGGMGGGMMSGGMMGR